VVIIRLAHKQETKYILVCRIEFPVLYLNICIKYWTVALGMKLVEVSMCKLLKI